MRILRERAHRLWVWSRRRSDDDLTEELRLHQQLAVEDALRRGLAPDAAVRAAAVAAGGHTQAMEALRDQRGLAWLDDLARDARHAARTLRRNPMFTAVVLVTLALGIGANALIFSVINVVLLMRFPYSDAERLVLVQTTDPKGTPRGVAPADFVDWRRQAESFEQLSAKIDWSGYNMTGPEGPERSSASR
jgi:hypothetical protein